MVELLLKHNAKDVNAKDLNGDTALHYAARNGNCWRNKVKNEKKNI